MLRQFQSDRTDYAKALGLGVTPQTEGATERWSLTPVTTEVWRRASQRSRTKHTLVSMPRVSKADQLSLVTLGVSGVSA